MDLGTSLNIMETILMISRGNALPDDFNKLPTKESRRLNSDAKGYQLSPTKERTGREQWTNHGHPALHILSGGLSLVEVRCLAEIHGSRLSRSGVSWPLLHGG